MHILILICLMFSFAHTLQAIDTQDLITPNTYNGTVITSKTLLELSDQFDGSALRHDPTDCSHGNMNIPMTNNDKTEYWIKISGRTNRTITGMHTNGADGRVWTDRQYCQEQRAYLAANPVDTYQTASSAAYYLIAQQAKQKLSISTVSFPRTSLYSTNGSSINDDHALIRQEHIEGSIVEYWLKEGHQVPAHTIKELFQLIESVGLWNPKYNIIVDNNNHLFPIDLEQPNNSDARKFFNQDPERYHGNVVCGLKELFTIFTYPEARRTLIEMIDLSDILSHEQFTQRYQKEIIDFAASSADK